MTVQEISDEFTLLSHQGKAQAKVMHIFGNVAKEVAGIEMIGDDIALIKSEKTEKKHKTAEAIKEKLRHEVFEFVESKDIDYKKDVIKHQTLKTLIFEFTLKHLEDICADFDYFIEGKDLEIKQLGERCNQLLKDKGDLTDKCRELEIRCNELFLQTNEQAEQIEKMKCCNNCFYDCEDCNSKNKNCDKCPCGTCVKHNHWEARR